MLSTLYVRVSGTDAHLSSNTSVSEFLVNFMTLLDAKRFMVTATYKQRERVVVEHIGLQN